MSCTSARGFTQNQGNLNYETGLGWQAGGCLGWAGLAGLAKQCWVCDYSFMGDHFRSSVASNCACDVYDDAYFKIQIELNNINIATGETVDIYIYIYIY